MLTIAYIRIVTKKTLDELVNILINLGYQSESSKFLRKNKFRIFLTIIKTFENGKVVEKAPFFDLRVLEDKSDLEKIFNLLRDETIRVDSALRE